MEPEKELNICFYGLKCSTITGECVRAPIKNGGRKKKIFDILIELPSFTETYCLADDTLDKTSLQIGLKLCRVLWFSNGR
jgi:hypothetical protein